MTPDDALERLMTLADAGKAAAMADYHKVPRRYLGVPVPEIDAMAREWRQNLTLDDRLALAAGLWDLGIHETMIAAAKLLAQARIRPDDSAAWALIQGWTEAAVGWAVADHTATAGQKRLLADPARIEALEPWRSHPNMWTRRATLVLTLPWARMNHPRPQDLMIRERVLTWASDFVADRDWFMQKAVAWWVRDLSRHDADRAQAWIDASGPGLKSFARKEAARHL